jgi:SOS-response transcriptional repressor LexA
MTERKQRTSVCIDYGGNKDFFAVRLACDDMINAHYQKGAVIILRKQKFANDGDPIIALHNGKLRFCFYKTNGDDIYLTAANNNILPTLIKPTDKLAILGKVCEVRTEVL